MRAAAGEMLPDDKRLADEWHLIIPESDRNFLDSASVTRHFNQMHWSTTQRQSERINDEQNECVASFVNVPRINSKDSFSYRFFTARQVLLLVFRYFLFFFLVMANIKFLSACQYTTILYRIFFTPSMKMDQIINATKRAKSRSWRLAAPLRTLSSSSFICTICRNEQ